MSYKVKSNIKNPFDWMEEYEPWCLISDYSDQNEYGTLGNMFQVLVDGYKPDYFDTTKGESIESIKKEYQARFPMLLADVFEQLANDIRTGKLEIEINFD